jgi:RNA polymerase sigma-70 factor, ECF subfamily
MALHKPVHGELRPGGHWPDGRAMELLALDDRLTSTVINVDPSEARYEADFARSQGGDAEAFCALLRHHDPSLRRLAYRLVGSRQLMDDVLQEAFMKAFGALPRARFRGHDATERWLLRIVYTCAMDQLRRERNDEHEQLFEVAQPTPGLEVSDQVVLRLALVRALQELPSHQRALIALVDEAGFSYDEAGEILDLPRGTVASGLNRARTALKAAVTAPEASNE